MYEYVLFTPNILTIQYISARNGRNNVIIPPKKPASLKAIITVQTWVISAVITKTPNKEMKIVFNFIFLFPNSKRSYSSL